MGSTMRQSGAMLAGDVARVLGVGVQTLHYYEREGLVPRAQRSESGYRIYTPQLVERIRLIRKAKALGLPLDKVRDILRLTELTLRAFPPPARQGPTRRASAEQEPPS